MQKLNGVIKRDSSNLSLSLGVIKKGEINFVVPILSEIKHVD